MRKLNQRGQTDLAYTAVMLLVVAVVGLVVFEGVTRPLCSTANKPCETFNGTNSTYDALLHENIYEDSETAYNSSDCTGGALTNYLMNYTDGGVILTGDDSGYLAHTQSITYDYFSFGSGTFGGLLATIVCYMPILFAVGILAVAGYLWFKS